jgi:PhnB protein
MSKKNFAIFVSFLFRFGYEDPGRARNSSTVRSIEVASSATIEGRSRMNGPDGKIGHAELKIGDSHVMLSDPFPQSTTTPPKELGGTSGTIFMYVDDVDAVVQKAVDAGATVTMEVEDQFWGDRFGSITDPFGHSWSIATHVEDLTSEEIEERGKAAMAAMANA